MNHKDRMRNEMELTHIFHACLRDLGLPLDYLHTEEGKPTDYKRQQAGVRLKEAYDLGLKHAYAESMKRECERVRWVDPERPAPKRRRQITFKGASAE